MNSAPIVIWVYIGFLMIGGLIGLLKAGSKMSLIMSTVFALLLGLAVTNVIRVPYLTEALLGFLFLFFLIRFLKSKKMMPGGFMAGLTLLVLITLQLLQRGIVKF